MAPRGAFRGALKWESLVLQFHTLEAVEVDTGGALDEGDYRADMRRRVGAGSGVWVKILLRELLGLTESQPLALGAA